MPSPDSNLRLVCYRNNKHDPGIHHPDYCAWTLQLTLNHLLSDQPWTSLCLLLHCVPFSSERGVRTVDNSNWMRVFRHTGLIEMTCSIVNTVTNHEKESVRAGFDTWVSSLQPTVFGDINRLCVREADLHFVTEREVFSRGRAESWKDS